MEDSPGARAAMGARIARARLAAGYENAALFARKCDVTPNSVYRWERGEVVPDIFRLESVARAAGVSLEWLLRGTETTAHGGALAVWRETPKGRAASDAAIHWIASLPLEGYEPTLLFYDLALMAFEAGLSATEGYLGARFTESKRRDP